MRPPGRNPRLPPNRAGVVFKSFSLTQRRRRRISHSSPTTRSTTLLFMRILLRKNPSKGQEQKLVLVHWSTIIDALPDPFVLTSSDECDDPLEGAAGEPDRVEGVTTTDPNPAPVTTAETTDVGNAWTPKSCLRVAHAPSKGHTVTFKDPLLKFHFYYHPDPNDIWSRCGLPMRPIRKSFTSFLLILGRSPASHSETPAESYLLSKGSPCYIDSIQPSTVSFFATRAFVLQSHTIVVYALVFFSV